MNNYSNVDANYPADLVASVPYLLGYHPTDSLVVVTSDDERSDLVGAVFRIVLPAQDDETYAIAELLRLVWSSDVVEASLVVISEPQPDQPPEPLPRADFVRRLSAALTDSGVVVNCAVWAAATREGTPWRSYVQPDRHGFVPDPNATTIAAVTTLAGMVTYDSREQLAATLAPEAPQDVLDRRAELLTASAKAPVPGLDVLDAAIERFERGDFEFADEDFATLGTMLADPFIRDQWVGRCGGDHAIAAERLTLSMVRGLPAPWRAHAAAVCAFAAYLRGDGVLAGIAISNALEVDPGNNLANLLRAALVQAIHPDDLREVLNEALS